MVIIEIDVVHILICCQNHNALIKVECNKFRLALKLLLKQMNGFVLFSHVIEQKDAVSVCEQDFFLRTFFEFYEFCASSKLFRDVSRSFQFHGLIFLRKMIYE